MAQWRLIFDVGTEEYSVADPSLNEMIAHIDALDNHQRTFITLTPDNDIALSVVGGNEGRVMVTYFPPEDSDEESCSLVDTTLTGKDVGIVIQGHYSEHSPRRAVYKDLAKRAVVHFLQTQSLSEELVWEKDWPFAI